MAAWPGAQPGTPCFRLRARPARLFWAHNRQGSDAMKVDGKAYRTIWPDPGGDAVHILDQTLFPHRFETARLTVVGDAARAISDMLVRGAPLIGATAAYGMALAMRADASDAALSAAYDRLHATRPTAINLRWALDRMDAVLRPLPPGIGLPPHGQRPRGSATRMSRSTRPSATMASRSSATSPRRRTAGRSTS